MGFNLIFWTPVRGSYFLYGSILKKCGRIWPDWEYTTWADMAGLGFIRLMTVSARTHICLFLYSVGCIQDLWASLQNELVSWCDTAVP